MKINVYKTLSFQIISMPGKHNSVAQFQCSLLSYPAMQIESTSHMQCSRVALLQCRPIIESPFFKYRPIFEEIQYLEIS